MTYVKDWWKSRTVWVNLLAFAGFMVQAVTGQELLTVEAQAVVIAVLNIILRFQTTDPIR
mgnify:CR=1 FL=1